MLNNNLMSYIIKCILINILVGVILYSAFLIACFMLGYASNANHINEIWLLFIFFVISHLVMDFVFLFYKKKLTSINLIITSSIIIIIWVVLAFLSM